MRKYKRAGGARKRLSSKWHGKPKGRVYKTSRRRAKTSFKRKGKGKGRSAGVVKGGYLDKHANFNHGHNTKMSRSFVAKVRKAAAMRNYQTYENRLPSVCSLAGCSYAIPPPTHQVTDMITLAGRVYTSTPVDSTVKYNIDNVKAQYRVINPNNVAMNVRVYECTPRYDIPYTFNSTTTSLSNIVAQGFTDVGDTAAASEITNTLYQNPAFCSRFKILSAKVHKLVAGENMLFNLNQKGSHVINMARWISGSATPLIYLAAGLSKFLVFQYWGGEVFSQANPLNFSTQALVANVITQLEYEFSWEGPPISSIFPKAAIFDGALNQYTLATTIADPYVIVEQTGLGAVAT